MKAIINIAAAAASALLLTMCAPSVPADYTALSEQAKIYPDYAGITMPVNIAPLNFNILDSADNYVTHIHAKGEEGIVTGGATADFDEAKWKELLQKHQGDTLYVDIYAQRQGKWQRYPAIKMAVAEEIDPYISYRQIEPSYIGFEVMRICQRNLENFDEKEIFNNCTLNEDVSGQCINCHSYQDYNRTGNMQMHVRVNHGGTVIMKDGEIKKVNLKTPATISAGVYPSWHPTLPLIAYSNNTTNQTFHSLNTNKVEVQDAASDIILYDVDKNEVSIIANDSTELETFPYWSPDGNWLYYVSSYIPKFATEEEVTAYKTSHYEDYKYNIYRKPFDQATRSFGATDTVFMASERGGSATFPRVSPDGKYLLFTMAPYGTFHIWHKDADLYLMDLATREIRNLAEANSDDVESYHSFSTNGRWIIFSSRREDGSYTRLYITHFDENGRASKPFLLPQKDPEQNHQLYKSYNIPEFMVAPATPTRQQLIDAISSDAIDVKLKN